MLKVFVYGTLKPREFNYPAYCEGKVIEAIKAYTFGKLYHLPLYGYPAMTEGNEKIQGYLLTFSDSQVLTNLDSLEDYNIERSPTQNEYNRYLMTVYEVENSLPHQAWVYVMSLDKIKDLGGIYLDSGCWSSSLH